MQKEIKRAFKQNSHWMKKNVHLRLVLRVEWIMKDLFSAFLMSLPMLYRFRADGTLLNIQQ